MSDAGLPGDQADAPTISDGITTTMAQPLQGVWGEPELPPHGQDNRAAITRTEKLANTQ